MIAFLSGRLKRLPRDSLRIVVEVNGVGYEVLLPFFVRRTLEDKAEGDPIELEIAYFVSERQPRPLLVGFNREHEKTFFERLLEVEDIGPLKAANALVLSVSTIAAAIEEGDIATLKQMPGIGERTANRMVAALKGKVAQWALLRDEGFATVPSPERPDVGALRESVVEALVALGYRRTDARTRVDEAIKRTPQVKDEQQLLREVFRGERR
ncbi:MAG: Holliday junction DNA helicase RuvA [Chloroflexi bacterium]|nr:Holliday junction DNA helicase RuvA [Chloroflexota bacterium]